MHTMMVTSPLSLFATSPFDALGMRTMPTPMNWLYTDDQPHHYSAAAAWRQMRMMEQHTAQAWRHVNKVLEQQREQRRTASWKRLDDGRAELTVPLPAIKDDSLAAHFSEDRQSLTFTGKAATCEDATLFNVALPFGAASADELEIIQGDASLTVRAFKKKPPTLNLKILKESPPPPRDERTEKAEEAELNRKFKIAIDSVAKQAAAVEEMKAAVGNQAEQAFSIHNVEEEQEEQEEMKELGDQVAAAEAQDDTALAHDGERSTSAPPGE